MFLDHTQQRTSWQDSSGRVISSSQRPLPDNTRHSRQTNIHAPGGILTHNLSRWVAAWSRNIKNRCSIYIYIYIYIYICDISSLRVNDLTLILLTWRKCWDRGFKSHWGHGYLSVVSVVCCQAEVSVTSWSLVQRNLPTVLRHRVWSRNIKNRCSICIYIWH